MLDAEARRLLWIDDDRNGVAAAARLVLDDGIVVDVAECGAAGLAMASAGGYWLVLLDLQLPDTSGLEVLESFSRLGLTVPTVIVTGFATISKAVAAVRHGAVDVVEKPFFADDVLAVFNQHAKAPGPCHTPAPASSESADAVRRYRTLSTAIVADPKISLRHASRKAGLERHATEQLIRRMTGLCWRDWRRKMLMQRAAMMLESSDLPVKAFVDAYGYRSIQAFGRAFRAVWGTSPAQYRLASRSAAQRGEPA
jgi:ActR/RegA family two-component response regulator